MLQALMNEYSKPFIIDSAIYKLPRHYSNKKESSKKRKGYKNNRTTFF